MFLEGCWGVEYRGLKEYCKASRYVTHMVGRNSHFKGIHFSKSSDHDIQPYLEDHGTE